MGRLPRLSRTENGGATIDRPDDDFETRLREKLGPLLRQLGAEGRVRREDDKALVMYPEGTRFDEALAEKTMVYCRACCVLEEVRHMSPFAELTLPPCPICSSQAWEVTNIQEGKTDGHLSAPRVTPEQLANPTIQ